MTIKLPNNNKYTVPNDSDLFGSIHYTKNINLDEAGYLKLSPRVVSVLSDEDDTNFNLPTSFGRVSYGKFFIVTAENNYVLNLTDDLNSTIGIDAGSSNPATSFYSFGLWWRNKWHVTKTDGLFTKNPSSGAWTDASVSLTSAVSHPMADFIKAGTLMVANGNAVKQLNTSYATTSLAQLAIPTGYEVVSLAYNNNLLGIGTRLDGTVEGQDIEAKFFTWDGSESSPNAAFGVGSDAIVDVVAYKSSFVLLTRNGDLLYFNGGGFTLLASFPIYFKDIVWGDFQNKVQYGNLLKVDGDNILININNYIRKSDLTTYEESFIAGVWVFDPNVGLYHRYSPSISKAQMIYVVSGNINTTTDTFTVSLGALSYAAYSLPSSGAPVKILTTTANPLHNGTIYYLIKVSSSTFRLAATYEDALAGQAINMTSASNTTMLVLDVKDYSQSRTVTSGGAVSIFGYKAQTYENVIFGGRLLDSNSTTSYSVLNVSVSGFKNIGYVVTPKIKSQGTEDNIKKLTIKYKPLKTLDSIVIKYKNKDSVGIPEQADCTATSTTVLTTTDYIPYSDAYTGELECEVIAGAGAGQMVKVTSISESAGTYTITLTTALDGVAASDKLTVKLDNWNTLETITSADDNNWKEVPIAKSSKWTKLKVILIGSDVTIEDLLIDNISQLR